MGVQTGSAYLLSLYLEKPKSVTLSDWKAATLSPRQVEYSAMDAVISLNCMLQALAL
jgi:ribonuclease D